MFYPRYGPPEKSHRNSGSQHGRHRVSDASGQLPLAGDTIFALLEGSSEALCAVDRQWRYVYVNAQAERLTGMTRDQMLGRSIWELWPESVGGEDWGHLHRAMNENVCVDFRHHYRANDTYMEVRASPCASGLVIFFKDVTHHVRLEGDRHLSEQRYRSLVDAVVQLMWMNDAEGRPMFRNRRWYEYTGLEETAEPVAWGSIIHADDIDGVQAIRRRAIAEGEPYQIEYRLRRHDGEYRWHLARVVPLKDAGGRVINWFGTATDVHDMKLADQETRKARQEAEGANAAKDQFLAVLSHELRTPLTPVVMTVAAMEMDRSLSPQLREDLTMIRRNIELETKLIDDLLDVTRIANGKIRLTPRPTQVHALLKNVLDIVRADITEKRLIVRTHLGAADCEVWADPARLQQIFWNLIKNAIKFTPAGGYVDVVTANVGERIVKIEVIDSGVGIEPAVLERVFNAFDQGEAAVTRQFGGLGLGLAISKALAELHGGAIRAESEGKGRGSKFIVELPARGAVQKLVDQIQPLHGSNIDHSQRLRLLLVEDHADTRRMLHRLLEERRFTVFTAGSVAAALSILSRENIDVLISDIGLPDASGHDLMRQVARVYESIVGVAISGFGMDSDVKLSREAGFAVHLTKPVDLDQLESLIRTLSRRHTPASQVMSC